MRKFNWFVVILTLVFGMTLGVLGFSLTNPTSANSLLTKFRGGTNTPAIANVAQQSGGVNQGNSMSVTADVYQSSGLTDPNLGDSENQAKVAGSTAVSPDTSANSLLVQQIISDYKQDVGIFFDAWKNTDMIAFRAKLAKGYTGAILEKHANRAEAFITQGVGLEVSAINFDKITVEKVNNSTATLSAHYRYTATDYSFENAAPAGPEHEQNVNLRVNLIHINNKWLITGESVI